MSCGWIAAGSRACCQVVANIVVVIALVTEEPVRIDVVQLYQRIVAFNLMRFAAGHVESQRVGPWRSCGRR